MESTHIYIKVAYSQKVFVSLKKYAKALHTMSTMELKKGTKGKNEDTQDDNLV